MYNLFEMQLTRLWRPRLALLTEANFGSVKLIIEDQSSSFTAQCHGYSRVLSVPDPWIFLLVDWISDGTACVSIFISSSLFSINKYVVESSHLGDFYYNKIDCNILVNFSGCSFFNNSGKWHDQASVHKNITSIHMKRKNHHLDIK
jgi:hypothetical protein